jgi:hypothetical protein
MVIPARLAINPRQILKIIKADLMMPASCSSPDGLEFQVMTHYPLVSRYPRLSWIRSVRRHGRHGQGPGAYRRKRAWRAWPLRAFQEEALMRAPHRN